MANFRIWVVWLGAAFACLVSALAVVSFRNPFYSALALIGNLASLAVLYLVLSGEFVAAGQVLVYGGGGGGVFLFLVSPLRGPHAGVPPWGGAAGGGGWGLPAGGGGPPPGRR